MKPHDQRQLGKERFIALTGPHSKQFIIKSIQGPKSSRAGSWRQELIQRSWRGATHGLALHGLFFNLLLIESRTTSPEMASLTRGWTFLHPPLIKKMPYRPILGRFFSQLSFLPSDNSSPCQIDIKLAITLVKVWSISAKLLIIVMVLAQVNSVFATAPLPRKQKLIPCCRVELDTYSPMVY